MTLRACAEYKPQWVAFPEGFLRDPEVTPQLKGMMAVLCTFLDAPTGFGAPTYRALSLALGVKDKVWIRRMIRTLAALGYADIEERRGSGLEYRLKGGPVRLDLSTGGRAEPYPPGRAEPYPPGRAEPYPMILIDDLITILKNEKYGAGAADAAAIAQALPPERLREVLAFVDANPNITKPLQYVLAAAKNERRKPRKPAIREQLPLEKQPAPNERRLVAVPEAALPPEDASWLTDTERRARSVASAKSKAFPQFARHGA